nr:RWP-RK domain-containing protein [Ipomoea batatas]
MADPSATLGSAFFPYYDHHHSFDHHLPFDQIPLFSPPELETTTLQPQSDFAFDGGDYADNNIVCPSHLLEDPVLSTTFGEVKNVPQVWSDVENPTPISAWPPAMASLCNNSCQILREITHTNGLYIWRLEIHGGLGMIAHVVLEKCSLDFSSQNPEYQTIDFSQESMSAVKQFLVGYFEDRKQEGYVVLEDPLWEFYEALSVAHGGGEHMDIDTFFQLPPTTHSGNYNEEAETGGGGGVEVKAQKIPLSAQRERTGKLRLKDFAGYLHLPIEEAARRMNICPTVMKKICRRDGLLRWPYRKIRSIHRKISNRSKTLSAGNLDAQERERAQADILDLQQQLATISEAFFD